VAVIGRGKYLKAPLEKIADFDPRSNECKLVRKESDPVSIDLPDPHVR
jgi:hypothetical protein